MLTRDICDVVCIIDADTLWLQPWSSFGLLGFIFASVIENPVSFKNHKMMARKIEWLNNYGRVPGDKLKITFPGQFVTGHPILKTIVDEIQHLCPSTGFFPDVSDWKFVMNAYIGAIEVHGLRNAIVAHEIFSPMHWYWRQTPFEALAGFYEHVHDGVEV